MFPLGASSDEKFVVTDYCGNLLTLTSISQPRLQLHVLRSIVGQYDITEIFVDGSKVNSLREANELLGVVYH